MRIPAHEWEAPPGTPLPAGGSHTSSGQLIWLTLLIGVATIPHAGTAAPWVLVALLIAVVWRLGAALRRWPLPGTAFRVILTIVGSLGIVIDYRRISGLDAGSALLILMLALKLLETHSARDRSIIILIAWFVLFASFLREQSLISVPQLAAGVVIGTLALAQSARPAALLTTTRGLQTTGRLLLHALPLALALFLLFPRLPGPFWALPKQSDAAQTGLTDQMSPGDITALAQSDEVAFRVRFNGPTPKPAELYWRGPVLEKFDGRSWRARPDSVRNLQAAPADYEPTVVAGQPVYHYEITLEANQRRWLLPLETPIAWDAPGSRLTGTLELLSKHPVDSRMAWRGESIAAGEFNHSTRPDPANLELGKNMNARSIELGQTLRRAASSDEAYLRQILRMFREQAFFYTLKPPALRNNPVDEFLFTTRAGFCEHYASAFALLARSAGIPARVVAGYQGGQQNPVADYLIVRQSDAHAWTEVWLNGRWIRYDPTAAVAPERIENGLEAAFPDTSRNSLPLLGTGPWLERLALSWDAINATWDRWVLAFGPDQQAALLQRLGIKAPSLRDIALVCALAVCVMLALFSLLGMRARPDRSDPVDMAWQRLCRRLGKLTRPRQAEEGPSEYAAAVAALRPDLEKTILAIANEYLHLRYDTTPTPAQIRAFSQRVRKLHLPTVPVPG
ncbi:MAG: DUF3488 and transglutaminase-like domain-containing protein [Gammaproteobacteria bacterium]